MMMRVMVSQAPLSSLMVYSFNLSIHDCLWTDPRNPRRGGPFFLLELYLSP